MSGNEATRGGDRGGAGAARCTQSARVLAAVRLSLSEENSSSSSLPGLSSELKQHLAACAACAAEAAALDPTLLFAPLAASVSPDPPARGASLSAEEDARLVADAVLLEVGRRARVTSPVPLAALRRGGTFRRLAPLAAALLLTAGLAGLVRWETAHPADRLALTTTPSAAPSDVPASAAPLIEGVRNPNARVYEFAASSPQEPAVVFVANPNADL
jgi:anti-sigma factor RsiW